MDFEIFLSSNINLCLLYILCPPVALNCKQCLQYSYETDNEDVENTLSVLDMMSNQHCKSNAGDSSVTDIPCQAPAGMKPVCSTMAVGANFKVPSKYIVHVGHLPTCMQVSIICCKAEGRVVRVQYVCHGRIGT